MTASTARTALVTGAASGIGAGVAQHLASLGHRVGLLDRDHTGAQEVADALRAGRIVNISSISALGHGGRANYISAKAGIEAFTTAVAHEVAGDGITVNAIGPGVIVTKMTELGAQRAGRSLADHIEVLRQTVPVGRVGTPDDIARAVAFFAADDADFITGQVIYVSGGPHG